MRRALVISLALVLLSIAPMVFFLLLLYWRWVFDGLYEMAGMTFQYAYQRPPLDMISALLPFVWVVVLAIYNMPKLWDWAEKQDRAK